MMTPLRRLRRRLADLADLRCLPKALPLLTFPFLVILNRLAAELLVLIFGIDKPPLAVKGSSVGALQYG